MDNLADELHRLREDDPELALVLDSYRESRRVYREVLEARRVVGPELPRSSNSAKVTVSARPTVSLPEYTMPVTHERESD